MVKRFLTISRKDHELLSSNLSQEDILNKFKKERRFRRIFKFQNYLTSALKQLQITQRILFALMEKINNDIDRARVLGKDAGIQYPDNNPKSIVRILELQSFKDSWKYLVKNIWPLSVAFFKAL